MKYEELGQVVATAAVNNFAEEHDDFSVFLMMCMHRYLKHDWGDLSEEDQKQNDYAVKSGDERILAAYKFPEFKEWDAVNFYGGSEDSIWIITEWDRSVTTILFPGEY